MGSVSFQASSLLSSAERNFSAEDMLIDKGGNTIIVGWTDGDLGTQQSIGIADAFIASYSSSGELAWSNLFGGHSIDRAYAVSAHDDSIYVAGSSATNIGQGENLNISGAFVRKYSVIGEEAWTKMIFDSTGSQSWGSGITSIVAHDDGYIYFAGSAADGPNGGRDMIVGKMNNLGELQWLDYFGGSKEEFVYAMDVDTFGNIYVAGYTATISYPAGNQANQDGFVWKFNNKGQKLWSHIISTEYRDHVHALTVGNDGFVYIGGLTDSPILNGVNNTGNSNADGFVIKMSDQGDLVWTQTLGYGDSSFEQINDIYYSVDDGIYATGETAGGFVTGSAEAGGGFDALVVNLSSSDGSEIWATQFGGDYFDHGNRIEKDSDGVIRICGTTSSTIFLDQENQAHYNHASNSFLTLVTEREQPQDNDGDGFVDGLTNYQLWTEKGGIDLKSRRGNTYSDDTSRKWDAIKAVETDAGFSVLVEGHLSKEGKYKVVTANEEGVIGGATRWLNGNQMFDSGYEEVFSMDFNGNGVVDLL